MQARIQLIDKVCLHAKSDSGHSVIIDGAPEIGGQNSGMRPMEMVLLGLGGCTAMDVLSMLKKQRQDITDCVIELQAERREQVPKIFSEIHIRFVVTGRDLNPKLVQRAADLSAEKYCSVSEMLRPTVAITHSVEIVDANPAAD